MSDPRSGVGHARPINILHAPSPLGLKPPEGGGIPGVRRAPHVLREAGLHAALGARFVGEIAPPPYVAGIDEATRVRNPQAIARYSVQLADAIERLLEEPGLALVIGGDCSILIGTALGLRRSGRYGVIYVDAHPDYLTVDSTATGGVAGMPLAIVTGLGPELLTDLEGRRPYIREDDAVVVGSRDPFQVRESRGANAKHVEGSRIRVHDLDDMREHGARELATEVLSVMAARGVDGVWIHLDADVLDASVMPAVDSPEPGGMSPAELVELLGTLVASPLARGLQVTIYDPERDPDKRAGRLLVDLLVEAMR